MQSRFGLVSLALALVAAACGGEDAPAPAVTDLPTAATEPATTASAATTPIPTTPIPTTPSPTTQADATQAPATSAPAATDPPPTTTAPEPAARFALVSFSLTPASQHVVIQNVGDASGSLQGFAICQAPRYHVFDDIELAPGELLAVSLGGDVFLPPPGAKTASASIGSFSPADGELGLYSRNDFSNSSAIVDYVEWGSSGHRRSTVALGALIWDGGDFVDTAGADSVFMFVTDLPSDGAEDWEVDVTP